MRAWLVQGTRWWVAWLLPAPLLAYAAALRPKETAAVAVLAAAVAVGLLSKERPAAVIRYLLAGLLIGYAFFGRSFAYLGVAPYYVGEAVLALALTMSLASGTLFDAFRSRLVWLVALFACWGAVRTSPYIPVFGTDALRDAVVWGYGAFALVVAAALRPCRSWDGITRVYRFLTPAFLLWILALGAAGYASLTAVSGSGGEFGVRIKAGDASVHLAGIGAFLILGLHRQPGRGRKTGWAAEWSLWALWIAGFLMFGSLNRGGLVSVLAGVAVVVFLRFRSNWAKLAMAALAAGALFTALGLEVDLGTTRAMSPRQVAANLGSLFGEGSIGEGTRRWRLEWWRTIIGYTVYGEHFWEGKGFGVNLADEDGFQTDRNHALRSAHNGHLTILARMGVPGFAIWVLLQAGLWLGLLRAYTRARRSGDRDRAAWILWVLAYLTAALANSTFDVYLEGPQGGIWFWALAGSGIALIQGRPRDTRRRTDGPLPLWIESWKTQRC